VTLKPKPPVTDARRPTVGAREHDDMTGIGTGRTTGHGQPNVAAPVAALTCVTFDCADPSAVATFWSAALGWDRVRIAPDGTGAICSPPDGGPYLEFVRVPEPKRTKNRLHLGCSAASLDELQPLIDRLLSLGATIAWEEELPPEVAAGYRNVILRDPEGNELCLGGGSFPD
jgi:hypothetical protein